MEKTRTLPPLVRGRVTGVLDFVVEEIRLKNTLFALDNFDLVLQVQWWGESSPIYVRPKKACCPQSRINRNSESLRIRPLSARYEIKTTLDLFKLYLITSEVLELCILDAIDNCILGSAFLKGLVDLLNKKNEIITMPIFDYLGEEIGEVVIIFNFLYKPWKISEKKHEAIAFADKNKYCGKLGSLDRYNSNQLKESYFSYFTPAEKNLLYYKHKIRTNGDLLEDLTTYGDKNSSKESKKVDSVNQFHHKMTDSVSLNCQKMNVNKEKVGESETYFCENLPEITALNDSSKVLYFGLNSHKCKQKIVKNPKIGVTNRFNSNSIKFKSKKAEKSDSLASHKSFFNREQVANKASQSASTAWEENPTKKREIKKTTVCTVDKSMQSDEHTYYIGDSTASVPSRESLKTKVLDYLLGSELSKEDEESAVNEFKKMSPSQDLVSSINKLCLTSDSDSFKSGNKHCTNSLESLERPSRLNFDLNNPIERNYFEKFFAKSNPSLDLELAEFLNQPENCDALEKLKSNERAKNKSFSQSSSCKSSKLSLFEKETQKHKSNENLSEDLMNAGDKAKGCARCKYYKKLEELDKIIESLKHFEKKMLSDEKDMKSALARNRDLLIRGSRLKNS